MAAPVMKTTEWDWPADVLAFAAKHEVQQCLEPLLAATLRIFPTARWVKVYMEDDPEIRDDWHILFDVQVAGLDLSQSRAADKEWHRVLLRCCPTTHAWIFRLLLDLQS